MKTYADVGEYLAAIPEPARATLHKIRKIIQSVVPAEPTEGMSYGMPSFRYMGPLFGYAAFKGHCSLFTMSAGLIVEFAQELRKFVTSKGTIRFGADAPPEAALTSKLVKRRIVQNVAKRWKKGEDTRMVSGVRGLDWLAP